MSWRVLWAPEAEHQLEELLRDPVSQAIIAAAAKAIDRQLLAAPLAFGESRFEDLRIGFDFPLGIHFEILADVRTVIVYDVWRIDVKRP